MSKVKRILSVIMAMVMVLAMSVPTFAGTGNAQITVHNAGNNAHFKAVRIVEPDAAKETGWKFADDYAQYFTAANAFVGMDEQTIIKGMIFAQNSDDDKGQEISGFAGRYANALKNIYDNVTVSDTDGGSPITVDAAGVYFVKGSEVGYTYNPMAAYISFGSYDQTSGAPTKLESKTIEAKREKTIITKTAEDSDRVTLLGREETFHVTSEIPFLPITDDNRHFYLKDTLTGGTYVTVEEGENVGKVDVTVTYGKNTKHYYVAPTTEGAKQRFIVNLSDLLENNAYANTALDISYKVKVTDLVVNNEAIASKAENASTPDFGSNHEDLFTGQLTMIKWDEKKTTQLKGAGFTITRKDDTTKLKFTQESVGVYKYDAVNGKEEVFTGNDGRVVVKGLDCGTYVFTETTAPEGYSLNTETKEATISLKDGKTTAEVQTDIENGSAEITDTKLSALPSTGGIGTTIFTIGGCAIMIVAAGLFFATRRKTQK